MCEIDMLKDGICLFTGKPCNNYPKCVWRWCKNLNAVDRRYRGRKKGE